MAWLAATPGREPVRVKDLSVATDIPSHYLSKVMRRLVLAGLVVSQRGQGGGFVLSKAPAEIAFIDILTAVDAYRANGHCAFGWGECDEVHPCPLHGSWRRLDLLLRSWAEDTTLADIAKEGVENRERRMGSPTG
jgi:Rrf2 family protein